MHKKQGALAVGFAVVIVLAGGLYYLNDRFGATPADVFAEVVYLITHRVKTPPTAPPPAKTRDARWQQDIDYFAAALPELHVNAFHAITREQFLSEIAGLKLRAPSLQDHQITAEIARITAEIGDGHTSTWRAIEAMPIYPFSVRWFRDGHYVIRTGATAAQAQGMRLIMIGNTPIDSAAQRMSVYLPFENEWNERDNRSRLLTVAPLLDAARILTDTNTGSFTFANSSGTTFTLQLTATARVEWLLAPHATLFFLQSPEKFFWLRHLPDTRVLWVKINVCADASAFAELATQALALIDRGQVSTVVIDWRGNSGGNSAVFWPLLNGLRGRTQRHALTHYGVIDRRTYSSALLNAMDYKRLLYATLLGEPTGQRPNSYGEVKTFELPNSRINVQYSTRQFAREPGDTDALRPDVPIELESNAYFAGRDPVFDAVVDGALRR